MNDKPNTPPITTSPIKIPAHIEAQIEETVRQQAAEDNLGMLAAQAATPGITRNVWEPAPDIEVGPYKVRRFRDGDFILLAQMKHPLERFSALSDGSYGFEPSGVLAHQLCWLMTRPVAAARDALKVGVDVAKEMATDEFGDLPLFAIGDLMKAIAKQMEIYAAAHIATKPKGDEKSGPP